jgi:hypothetical protein
MDTDINFMQNFISETKCWHPSAGLLVGAYIKSNNLEINKNSFFGFSHKEEQMQNWGTHYTGSTPTEEFSKEQSRFVYNPHMKEHEMSLKYIFGHNLLLEKKIFMTYFD